MNKKNSGRLRGIILVCICIAGFIYVLGRKEESIDIQKGIAKEIIRFHVIANSDTPVDQGVKLVVKDKVVTYMQKKLRNTETKEEAKEIMKKEIPAIQNIAQKTVRKEGYPYSCNVMYHQRTFPVKVYGDLTFPAGKYEALDIVLGNAEGKNWWCVMFPSLCFVDGTYSIVPEDSKESLKGVLTEEEFQSISKTEGVKVSFDFKIREWITGLGEKVEHVTKNLEKRLL